MVLVLDLAAAVAELGEEHEDGLKDIGGLEAGEECEAWLAYIVCLK